MSSSARPATGRCEGCGEPSSFRLCYRCLREGVRGWKPEPPRAVCGAQGRAGEACTLDGGHGGVFHELQRHGVVVARWPMGR